MNLRNISLSVSIVGLNVCWTDEGIPPTMPSWDRGRELEGIPPIMPSWDRDEELEGIPPTMLSWDRDRELTGQMLVNSFWQYQEKQPTFTSNSGHAG